MKNANLEVANAFLKDAIDLLERYRLTADSFWILKSRRAKMFIDLRIAYECVLKAHIAYNDTALDSRASLIRRVESFGHDVQRLLEVLAPNIDRDLTQRGQRLNVELTVLPVSLRYSLDIMDFLESREEHYYSTIGRDEWLNELADFVRTLALHIDKKLQAHSKVVSGSELWDSLEEDNHNKYRLPG